MNFSWMPSLIKIYTDAKRNPWPLPPLQDAMQYQYEEKKTNDVNGSKVLPYDRINAEMLYPKQQENKDTTTLCVDMAAEEVAPAIIEQCVDSKKALSNYLTSIGGKFSWGKTTEDEHQASIGKNAKNDPTESQFAALTQQLHNFGRILGIHASVVGQARINGDFKCDIKTGTDNGSHFKLSDSEQQSLLTYALCSAPAVRIEEEVLIRNQQEAKDKKKELLWQKKMLVCQKEYRNKLTYIEMKNLPAV